MGIFDQLRSIFDKTTPGQPTDDTAIPKPPPGERRRRKRINPREGTRVLIIDDSPTVVATLRKIMRSVNCVPLEALDAERGVELARLERPDLVFLDLVLPGMDGFAALRTMRRDPITRHIPVILISGNEQATEQFYANRIGADDFMKKPFSRLDVFSRIERLLDADLIPRRVGVPIDEADSTQT
ncbi:MAG TPA: response regulator [Burkholderiales bacterium]|nr:response regulator [Burkholderiales bacterium]